MNIRDIPDNRASHRRRMFSCLVLLILANTVYATQSTLTVLAWGVASTVGPDAAPRGDATPPAAALLAGAAPSQDYPALAARFSLHLIGGLPVIGGSRGVLTDDESEAVAKFLDYVELGIDPGFIEDEPSCWATTHLPEDTWSTYLLSANSWKGANEFERKRTHKAFLEDQVGALRAAAVPLPLEVVVINERQLPTYDEAAGGFGLGFENLIQHGLFFDVLDSYRNASVSRPACRREHFSFAPPAVVPGAWTVDATEAEAILNRLHDRKVYITFVYRFRAMPLAKVENSRRPTGRVPVWSEITTIGVYEDAELERLITTIPLNTGKAPVLLSGMPSTAQPAPEPVLDDITVALLLLRDHGDVLGPKAWHKLMKSQAATDAAYFARRLDPRTGAIINHNKRTGSYDPRYVPFFPSGFKGNRQDAFPDPQVAQFKQWAMLRARNLPDELMLRVRTESTDSNDALNIVLPVARDRLSQPLVAEGYSANQILRLNEKRSGSHRSFDFDLISGATTQRGAALVLPRIAADYIPDLTAGDNTITSETMRYAGSGAEIAMGNISSTIVRVDEETELVAVAATPKRLVVRGRDGAVVLETPYETGSLDPKRLDYAKLVTTLPDGAAPYLTAEIVDLLVVRHQPGAVSDSDYDKMMVARWAYEASVPPDEGDPDWGRFFVPGKPAPTAAQRAALLKRFKHWTADRAAALPDRFKMHYRSFRLNDGHPVSVRANPQEFDPRVPAGIVRQCESQATSHPALKPGCEYLQNIHASAPDIHPFGFGYAKGGPRLVCATVLPDHHDPYCKAREALLVAIGGRDYEPGYRDVFVLDKEIFFTGTKGEVTSLNRRSSNLLLEIAIADVRIAGGPLPRPFDVARERFNAYRKALGLRDDGRRKPDTPTSRTTFVFATTLLSATLLKNKTHEPIATFELRPPRAVHIDALERTGGK